MSKSSTLRDHGAMCVSLLLGLANAPFIPDDLRKKLLPLILGAMILHLLFISYRNSKHSKEESERERRDERSRMIYEKAVLYSSTVEDWALLGLFAWFSLGLDQSEIAYTFMWILIVRYTLTFVVRWWMDRKY